MTMNQFKINRNINTPILYTKPIKRIVISNNNGNHFINQNAILYLRSEGNYCHIYLVDGTRILCSKTLKSVSSQLNKEQFVRSHNSIVINWNLVTHINNSLDEIKLVGGTIVPISRARKKELKWKINTEQNKVFAEQ